MAASRSESFGQRYSARIGASARAQASSTELLFSFLRTTSSEKNLATSTGGGTSSEKFRYSVPENREAFIERMMVVSYGVPINPNQYVGSTTASALSNGHKVELYPTTSSTTPNIDFLDGLTITRNADWGWLAGPDTPVANSTAPVAIDGAQTVRWTLGKTGFGLRMSSGQSIAITVQDNLTALGGLTEVRAIVQGAIFSST